MLTVKNSMGSLSLAVKREEAGVQRECGAMRRGVTRATPHHSRFTGGVERQLDAAPGRFIWQLVGVLET
jgi:hypothetical protein